MMTLRHFLRSPESIPASCAWRLAELSEERGRLAAVVAHYPQRMQALRETSLIDSIVFGCRRDGLDIGHDRLGAVLATEDTLRDRTDREIKGYRDALVLIHGEQADLSISDKTIRRLHRLLFPDARDAGAYDQRDRQFASLAAELPGKVHTADCVVELVRCWQEVLSLRTVHPVVAAAGFELDFCCLRPFEFGNDRVPGLLRSLLAYHVGIEVGQFISFERLIDQSGASFRESFRTSSSNWELGTHDPWPYVDYQLSILNEAYKEFHALAAGARMRRGAKSDSVLHAIRSQADEFKLIDIQRLCPNVGRDLIRSILADLRAEGKLICTGRGPAARWRRARGD